MERSEPLFINFGGRTRNNGFTSIKEYLARRYESLSNSNHGIALKQVVQLIDCTVSVSRGF